tara:strand:- start:1579 stop:2226 length:648 start_codon:yes stop_codon:yes gene_type:complete
MTEEKSSSRKRSGNEELANIKRSDVLDKILIEYLSGTPDNKTEYTGFVRAIVPFLSPVRDDGSGPLFPLADEISAIDPFYNPDEDRERIMNAGRISEKGASTKVVLYVEIPLLFEKLIKIMGAPPFEDDDGNAKVPTKKELDAAKDTSVYSLHTLLRVDMVEGERQTKTGEAVIVSFKDKGNLRQPFFVRYPKNVPSYAEEDVKDKTKIAESFVS